MSAARCEPPEHLRGVDGWHWVELFGHTEPVLELWSSANQMWLGIPCDPDYAHDAGYRYLFPVAPPAVVRGLVEALERIERWHGEFPSVEREDGTHVSYGWAFGSNGQRDFMRNIARAALKAAKEAGV